MNIATHVVGNSRYFHVLRMFTEQSFSVTVKLIRKLLDGTVFARKGQDGVHHLNSKLTKVIYPLLLCRKYVTFLGLFLKVFCLSWFQVIESILVSQVSQASLSTSWTNLAFLFFHYQIGLLFAYLFLWTSWQKLNAFEPSKHINILYIIILKSKQWITVSNVSLSMLLEIIIDKC